MSSRINMNIAPFTVDLTPPIGFPLAYGVNAKTDTPIHLRGIVVADGKSRCVLASAEIIGLEGGAYQAWRRTIARAAGTTPQKVLLHSVHQHDSLYPPSADVLKYFKKHKMLGKGELEFWKTLQRKISSEIEKAVSPTNWKRVSSLASAERRLSNLASNRRLLGPDGKVTAMRYSMTSSPTLQAYPVGRIDPLLRTIGFLGKGEKVLASLHFYATHPMGAYLRNRVSADIPGLALNHLRKAQKDRGQHIYFTGCGGDITFGKYTYASKEKNLKVLGRRLGEGLIANVHHLEIRPLGPIAFANGAFEMPLDRKRLNEKSLRKKLSTAADRIEAFRILRLLETVKNWRRHKRTVLTRLSLGTEIQMLSLPAETSIDYQLYAQSVVPERFLAVAAYGDYTYHYISTEMMFKEGGYEPGGGLSTPAVEGRYKKALAKLLTLA